MRPASTAGAAASAGTPSRRPARHTRAGSPTGQAAATRSSLRVSPGKSAICRRNLSSIRSTRGSGPGSPKPPVSSVSEPSRGSSRSASGFPLASPSTRSRTRSSSGHRITEASSSRAWASGRPSTVRSGSPPRSAPGSRAAITSRAGSASSRRAAKANARSDARSSQWPSSIRHTSGRSSAASDNRLSTARPTRK
jgi:hypothetical protein